MNTRAAAIDPQQTTMMEESSVLDYLALLKPRVMSLVVFTGIAGMVIAPGDLHPFLAVVSIFALAIGAGAAGAVNMWYDRDIDAVMKRTRMRPIPAGKVKPEEALTFAVVMNVLAILLMTLAANIWAAGLLAFASFFYAVIYTMWLKRSTSQNIVIGGAAGAFPPVIGWVAVTADPFHAVPWVLFLIIFLWTPPHFWALALVSNDDYKKAGVPMLPVTHGDTHTRWQILLYSVILSAACAVPVVMGSLGIVYMISAIVLNTLFVIGAVQLFRLKTDHSARLLFGYSILYLFLIFTAVMMDHWVYY